MTGLFNRTVLIALATGALGACAMESPQYATSEGSRASPSGETAPPTAVAPSPPAPPVSNEPRAMDDDHYGPAYPSATVTTAPLPPLNRPPAQDVEEAPPPPPPPPPSRSTAAARRAPPPAPVRYIIQGPVQASPEPTFKIKVAKGDTVNVLAERYKATKKTIIDANKLKKPYELEIGQPIKIPTPKAYVVQPGDSLLAIGRRFTLSAAFLADLNDFDVGDHLRPGQKIALPVEYKDIGPLPVRGPAAPVAKADVEAPPAPQPESSRRIESAPAAIGSRQPYAPPTPYNAPSARPAPPTRGGPAVNGPPAPAEVNTTLAPGQVAAAGRGRFEWPLRGDTLLGFGPKPGGQSNDGVDIAAPLGTGVQAAADGDVVYVGNLVQGFGNLVLIKHAGGWVTAYAHLAKTEVKIKDHVSQGDEIGQVGQTGGAEQPELHFEIRYAPTPGEKPKPVDPTLVLPR